MLRLVYRLAARFFLHRSPWILLVLGFTLLSLEALIGALLVVLAPYVAASLNDARIQAYKAYNGVEHTSLKLSNTEPYGFRRFAYYDISTTMQARKQARRIKRRKG